MTENLPKADMRGVQFIQDAETAYYKRRVASLCERCGDYKLCDGSSEYADKELGVEVVVNTCHKFKPIIIFVNPKGTDGEYFNTIRLGTAWSRRVVDGSIVSLWDKKQRLGNAEVLFTEVGEKAKLLPSHASKNHMLIDEQMTEQESEDKIIKIVRNAYGNLIWKNNNEATIIYLKRLD